MPVPLRCLLGIAYTQTIVSLRNLWVYLSVGLIPGSLYMVLHLVGGRELSGHVLLGSLVTLATGAGLVALPQQIVLHRNFGLLDMYVASPVSPLTYLLGFVLGRVAFALPGLVLLLGLLLGLGWVSPAALPATLGVTMLGFIIGSMIGFTIASHIRDLNTTSAISNILNFAFMLLPPVLYPLDLVPEPYRWLSFLAPTTPVAELLRTVNGVGTSGPKAVWLHGTLVVAWVSVCAFLVVRKSRWREP